MLISQQYSLGKDGVMEVQEKGPMGVVIIIIAVAAIVGLAGWMTDLPAFFASFLLGLIAVMWYLWSDEALTVTPNRVEYRRKTLLGSHQLIAPRTTLLAVRLARSSAHEIRTFAVDLVLSHAGLPPAVRLYESLEDDRARAVASQVGTYLSAALLVEA